MRIHTAVLSTLTVTALSGAGGQIVVTPRIATGRGMTMPSMVRFDYPRAAIGVATSTSSGPRDTLGLLVSSVTRNGPAEKAGIEEGNRIAAINGISLRLAAADVGDPDMENLMSRRLVRELDKLKPGDDVDLKVYGGGQIRSLKVKTVDPESLYTSRTRDIRRDLDERPVLGISLGSTGSKRDTLGIFVMAVDDAGPAAKVGLEEGQRIAAINGVDVRVAHDDAGDDVVSRARVSRFNRELSKLKVGDAVDLRVYSNGQYRNLKATTVAASSLPNRGRSMTIFGNGSTMIRSFPPDAMDLDVESIGSEVRGALERASAAAGGRLQDLGRMLDGVGRGLDGMGGEVRWFDDAPPVASRIAPSKLAPGLLRRTSTTISM
jgi:membrane-associated protease RseP (regulator of RpoE activity)